LNEYLVNVFIFWGQYLEAINSIYGNLKVHLTQRFNSVFLVNGVNT